MHENSEEANAKNLLVFAKFSALRNGKFSSFTSATARDSKIFLHLCRGGEFFL